MESPTGIIPDELMHFTQRRKALNYLLSLPIDGELKMSLWEGWASWVGTHTSPAEKRKLFNSGI
jgi:hypothetical protein